MSGYILDQGAEILCLHGGQAQLTNINFRVKVSGQYIVTPSKPYTISACTLPPPPSGNGPCVTAQWISAATRVKAGGIPVLLQNNQAICAPTGTGLNVITTQTRVKGT